MILPKKEGGIGLRDPILLAKVATIKRTYRIWSTNTIWARWMKQRYIKTCPLMDIEYKARDSSIWNSMLQMKEESILCITFGHNYVSIMKVPNFQPS